MLLFRLKCYIADSFLSKNLKNIKKEKQGFVSLRRFRGASRLKNQYVFFFEWKKFPVILFNTECAVSIRCILSSVHIMMLFANVLHHGYFYQRIPVWVSDKGISEWESPNGKRYDFWEFFLCLIFVKHKSNNEESRRPKEKRESIWF